MNILVTGGAGYIGSHTTVELLNAGHKVIIADNLYNAHYTAVSNIAKITGKTPCVLPDQLCMQESASPCIYRTEDRCSYSFCSLQSSGRKCQEASGVLPQ